MLDVGTHRSSPAQIGVGDPEERAGPVEGLGHRLQVIGPTLQAIEGSGVDRWAGSGERQPGHRELLSSWKGKTVDGLVDASPSGTQTA